MTRAASVVNARFNVRSWPVISAALAALTLGLGYADLWRGGVTIAPVLITIGYLVLVPMAVMAIPRESNES